MIQFASRTTANGRESAWRRVSKLSTTRWLGVMASVSVLLVCAACDKPAPPAPAARVKTPASAPAQASSPPVAAASLRGYYEPQDGGVFTLCGETSRRRVEAMAESTRSALDLLQASPQPRYLAASGELVGAEAVRIGPFEIIGGDSWSCDTPNSERYYSGRGTVDLWRLEVTRSALTFDAGPGSSNQVWPYRRFQRDADELIYSDAESAPGTRIRLTPGVCREPMTDSIYALRATIEVASDSYAGCAWRGDREP